MTRVEVGDGRAGFEVPSHGLITNNQDLGALGSEQITRPPMTEVEINYGQIQPHQGRCQQRDKAPSSRY